MTRGTDVVLIRALTNRTGAVLESVTAHAVNPS
jgi:hypothetical protein